MNDIIISLPIYVELGVKKKKTFALNLNTYRNAYFQELNKAKVLFEELVTPLVRGLPQMGKVNLTYRLFFGSKRQIDVANVCCIVDKFFCDTLVNCNRLPGDDKDTISDVRYVWGGVDTKNPRVEVTLSDIELSAAAPDQDPSMQISFTHSEIKEALIEFLEKQIVLAPGQSVSLEFDLEDPTDIIAYLDVLRDGQKPQGMPPKGNPEKTATKAAEAPAPRKTRGPNKPKAEAAPVEPVKQEAAVAEEPTEDPVTEEPAADTEVEASEPPFKAPFADPATVAASVDKIIAEKEAQTEAQAQAAAVGMQTVATKPANSIFPGVGSSAPIATQAAPAAGAAAPKSLFAGLVRPSNAPTAH